MTMKRNFNFNDLRIFYTVVMAGGARQASTILHLTQPAISHAIARLEDATGVVLFDRQSKALRPTAAGRYLYEEARVILEELARVDDELHMIGQFGDRSLRITATPGLAAGFMAEVIKQYVSEVGQSPIALDMTSSVQAVAVVETGRSDMAVGAVRKESPGLGFRPFVRADVVAVLHRSHALAGQGVVSIQDIDPATFVKPLWSDYVVAQGSLLPPMERWSGIQAHMSLLPSMLHEFKGISFINALTAFDIVNSHRDLRVVPLEFRQWFEFYLIARTGHDGSEVYGRMFSSLGKTVEHRRSGVFFDVLTRLD